MGSAGTRQRKQILVSCMLADSQKNTLFVVMPKGRGSSVLVTSGVLLPKFQAGISRGASYVAFGSQVRLGRRARLAMPTAAASPPADRYVRKKPIVEL